jgi:hypothetical protein
MVFRPGLEIEPPPADALPGPSLVEGGSEGRKGFSAGW